MQNAVYHTSQQHNVTSKTAKNRNKKPSYR